MVKERKRTSYDYKEKFDEVDIEKRLSKFQSDLNKLCKKHDLRINSKMSEGMSRLIFRANGLLELDDK